MEARKLKKFSRYTQWGCNGIYIRMNYNSGICLEDLSYYKKNDLGELLKSYFLV